MNCMQTFAFLIGFTIGFFLIFSTFNYIDENFKTKKFGRLKPLSQNMLYKFWFNSNGFKSSPVSADILSFTSHNLFLESTFLYHKIKLTCVIFVTNPSNVFNIKFSWGKQCNSLHFYSKEAKEFFLPMIKVRSTWRHSSWYQLCQIMREIWSIEKIEWLLFAPDYALVIPENLRYLIAYRDPERSYYLGHTSHFWNQLYNSGETAYVLSRGALRKIVTKFNSSTECLRSGKYMNNEDYILGKHLSEMGVRPEDTRDEMGRQRFHLFTAAQLMFPDDPRKIQRFARKSVYPLILGSQCCSPSTVSFKSTPDNSRYWFYIYLLYRVRIFTSGNLGNNLTNIRSSSLEIAEKFIYDTLGKHVNISAISSDAYFMLWKLLIKSPEEFNEKIRKETLLESNSFIRNITHNSAVINTTPAVI